MNLLDEESNTNNTKILCRDVTNHLQFCSRLMTSGVSSKKKITLRFDMRAQFQSTGFFSTN